MRIDVPQFSMEISEGWGTPLLCAAGALAYGLVGAVTAGLAHRVFSRREAGGAPLPFVWPEALAGVLWPGTGLCFVSEGFLRAAVVATRLGVRPFAALARRVAGDTCPRT
jgi:hypothetical protein